MSTAYYKLYVDDVLALARSLVIKSANAAEASNAYLRELGYEVRDEDPSSWRYYKNMAGEYHPADKPMYVTSLDTLQRIEFTKESLTEHRVTKREYSLHGDYYKQLRAAYPRQVSLINGILNPVDLTAGFTPNDADSENFSTAYNCADGTILYYDPTLVESNERNLIPQLEAWLRRVLVRWLIPGFQLTDDMYFGAMFAAIGANIPGKLMAIRDGNAHTRYAHSFHIREFLASHGKLDTFIDTLTKKQMLWLYRNIRYIERNPGKQETFDDLLQNLLTERGIPLAKWDIRHDLEEQPEDIAPTPRLFRTALNFGFNQTGDDVRTVGRMLDAEQPAAKDNAAIQGYEEPLIIEAIETAAMDKFPTKVLESAMLDLTDSMPFTLSDTLLNHWIFWGNNERYSPVITVPDPRSGEGVRMTVRNAFIVYLWAYNKARGVDLIRLPKLEARHILRDPAPRPSELWTIVDRKYVKDNIVEALYAGHPDMIPAKIISTVTFYEACQDIFNYTMHQRDVYAAQEHEMTRGMTEALAHRFFYNVPVDFGINLYYEDWLTENNYLIHDYSVLELDLLATNILRAATGMDSTNTKSAKELQQAMISLMEQLSSYAIQFISSINSDALKMADFAVIRLGDDYTSAGDVTDLSKLAVRVLSADTLARHEVEYDMVGDMVEFDVSSTKYHELSTDMSVGFEGGVQREVTENVDVLNVRFSVVQEPSKTLASQITRTTLSAFATTARFTAGNYLKDDSNPLLAMPNGWSVIRRMNDDNTAAVYPHNATVARTGVVGSNAKVLVTAVPPRNTAELERYTGVIELQLPLLDLATYFTGANLRWDGSVRPMDVYEVVDWLNRKYGMELSRDEFNYVAIATNATTVTMTASAKSMRLKGSFTVQIPASGFLSKLTEMFG